MIAQLLLGAPFVVGPLGLIGIYEWREHRRWVADGRPSGELPEWWGQ